MTKWNSQCHKPSPQKLALTAEGRLGGLGHHNRAHKTGISHLMIVRVQLHRQQPHNGKLKRKHKLLFQYSHTNAAACALSFISRMDKVLESKYTGILLLLFSNCPDN